MIALMVAAIISCWTPFDSAELAQERGYELIDSVVLPSDGSLSYDLLIEGYQVGDDQVLVYYNDRNPGLWCYESEYHVSNGETYTLAEYPYALR